MTPEAMPTPDMTEREWLETWRDVLRRVEQLREALTAPDSGMHLTDAQAAHLEGEAAMLRMVLESRGINLDA